MVSLLVLLPLGITTVYSQCSVECNYADCTGATAKDYYCQDIQSSDCTDYTSMCEACQQFCSYSIAADSIFANTCFEGQCPPPPTPEPTESPLIPGSPTRAPTDITAAPTAAPHVCELYDTNNCANVGCGAEPQDEQLYCDTSRVADYVCSDHQSICSACCAADTISQGIYYQAPPSLEAYTLYCHNGVCPSVSPTVDPTPEPSRSTEAPHTPGTPTRTPTQVTPGPTAAPHICELYNSADGYCVTSGCDAEGSEEYYCDATLSTMFQGVCTNQANQCAACCEAEVISDHWSTQDTQIEAFDSYCAAGRCPTSSPTADPTSSPSRDPSAAPSNEPSSSPVLPPTKSPLIGDQTHAPTEAPSDASLAPSKTPSDSPSKAPTKTPSDSPSNDPSASPSGVPSVGPVPAPSRSPLAGGQTHPPSESPSDDPTMNPSSDPSVAPSSAPNTDDPSASPNVDDVPTATPNDGGSEDDEDDDDSDVAGLKVWVSMVVVVMVYFYIV